MPALLEALRSRSNWPMAKRVEQQARLMGGMMERLGVDPGAAAREGRGAALAAASRTCLLCGHSRACRQWLDTPRAAMPSFCPNAPFFERTRLGAPVAHQPANA